MKAIFINGSPLYTMNAPENLIQPLHYDTILGENCRVLGIFGGQPEM